MWNERVQFTVKRVDPCSNVWRSSFKPVLVLVRTRKGCRSNACRLSFERGKILVRTCFPFLLNAFRVSFEHVSRYSWMHVDAERLRSVFRWNAFALLLNAVVLSLEHIWLLFKCVWLLDWKRLASCPNVFGSRSNAFGFSSERVCLLIRACLTSHPNVFGFWFERSWLLVRTRPGIGLNSFIREVNAFEQQTCYTLCLTGAVLVWSPRCVISC